MVTWGCESEGNLDTTIFPHSLALFDFLNYVHV